MINGDIEYKSKLDDPFDNSGYTDEELEVLYRNAPNSQMRINAAKELNLHPFRVNLHEAGLAYLTKKDLNPLFNVIFHPIRSYRKVNDNL